MKIDIIGGTYREYCAWPEHEIILGSAGRAALCLSQIDPDININLHARIEGKDKPQLEEIFIYNQNCTIDVTSCNETTKFSYFHPLSEPQIRPIPKDGLPLFDLSSRKLDLAVIFGMVEATPIVNCDAAIYDPQNTYNPVFFTETGSKASRLAYVTNSHELGLFYLRENSQLDSIEIMAKWLCQFEGAEIVVVKCGKKGVFAYSEDESGWLPPYKTETVFPIGSGDSFVAAFTYYWQVKKLPLLEASNKSSIAAAHYVSFKLMNTEAGLEEYGKTLTPISVSSEPKLIYLAGPFFTLSEMWMVNEVKNQIESFGMKVFSPYHELGIGPADEVVEADIEGIKKCDAVYALFDGTDPGTLFEIGYARSIEKPVVILSENPKTEELKMYEGSGCNIYSDFSSSIYNLSWLSK